MIEKGKKEKLGIRERALFRKLFLHYLVRKEDKCELEEYIELHREIVKYIAEIYMPLWSRCIMEEGKSRDSNA